MSFIFLFFIFSLGHLSDWDEIVVSKVLSLDRALDLFPEIGP